MEIKREEEITTQEEIKNSKMFKEIQKSLEQISEQDILIEDNKLSLFYRIKNWIRRKI